MDGGMDGYGWMDAMMDGWIDGGRGRGMDGWCGWMDGLMDAMEDGWMDGRREGGMDGGMGTTFLLGGICASKKRNRCHKKLALNRKLVQKGGRFLVTSLY